MRMAFLGACALLLAGCSGSGALYLHSEKDAEEAAKTVPAFAEARKNHAAFLSAEMAFLEESEAENRKQVITAMTKRRDYQALTLLQASDKGLRNGIKLYLDDRITTLLGQGISLPDVVAGLKPDATADNLDKQIGRLRSQIERARAAFENAGGALNSGSKCTESSNFSAQGTLSDTQSGYFDPMKKDCEKIQERIRNKVAHIASNKRPSFLKLDNAGVATKYAGELKDVDDELVAIESAITAQKAIRKTVDEALAASIAAHKCALEQALPSERLEQNFVEIANFITSVVKPPAEPAASEAAETVNAKDDKQGAACADKHLILTQEELLKKTGFESLKEISDAIGDQSDEVAASLRELKRSITEEKAFEVLSDIAAHEPGSPITAERKEARVALAVIGGFGHFQDFVQAGTLPSSNALSVVASANRLAAEGAAIEAGRLKTRHDLYSLKRTAILSELGYLTEAASLRDRTKRIRRLANSWTYGRIQSEIADFEVLSAEHKAWLAHEQTATLAAYDIIAPALAELQTYSNSGFKPSLIAEVLAAVGITTIVFGGL